VEATQSESPAPRSGAGWIAGSAILVILTGLLTMVRELTPAKTTAFVIGAFVGGAGASALLGGLVYWIARTVGKKKPASTAARIVFWVLFVVLLLNILSFLGDAMKPRTASAQSGFTREEREGLRVDADSIRHTGLGFALPNPGPTFVADHEAERLLAKQFGGQLPSGLINWAFRDTAGGKILIIQATKSPGLNKEEFAKVAIGARTGAARANGKMLSDTTIWDGPHREVRMLIQHPNGLYMVMRCLPSVKPRIEYIVCAQTLSADPNGLPAASNGLNVQSQ